VKSTGESEASKGVFLMMILLTYLRVFFILFFYIIYILTLFLFNPLLVYIELFYSL